MSSDTRRRGRHSTIRYDYRMAMFVGANCELILCVLSSAIGINFNVVRVLKTRRGRFPDNCADRVVELVSIHLSGIRADESSGQKLSE